MVACDAGIKLRSGHRPVHLSLTRSFLPFWRDANEGRKNKCHFRVPKESKQDDFPASIFKLHRHRCKKHIFPGTHFAEIGPGIKPGAFQLKTKMPIRLPREVGAKLITDVARGRIATGIDGAHVGAVDAVGEAVPPKNVVICAQDPVFAQRPLDGRMKIHQIGWADERREALDATIDESCRVEDSDLVCDHPLTAPDYRIWIVPEDVAGTAGSDGLEAALADELPEPDIARDTDK